MEVTEGDFRPCLFHDFPLALDIHAWFLHLGDATAAEVVYVSVASFIGTDTIDAGILTKEILQLIESGPGLSRIVVIQGSIPPISGHAFVAVVFWPPPIETIDRGMLVEHRDELPMCQA